MLDKKLLKILAGIVILPFFSIFAGIIISAPSSRLVEVNFKSFPSASSNILLKIGKFKFLLEILSQIETASLRSFFKQINFIFLIIILSNSFYINTLFLLLYLWISG